MILGNIRTLTKLDAESKPHYWITVMATDHGVAPLSSRLEVSMDVNCSGPGEDNFDLLLNLSIA